MVRLWLNPLYCDHKSAHSGFTKIFIYRCVDYVQVYRGGFGVTESCGTNASENTNQLELGLNKKIVIPM